MDSYLDQTIAHLQTKLKGILKQAAETKRVINSLCVDAGRAPLYADEVDDEAPALASIKGDTFYGQPLASAAAAYLRMRKNANAGPAKLGEVFDALKMGGFQFGAATEDYAKRGLRQALTKNSSMFHKLPNGDFGLTVWYPNIKPGKTKSKDDESDEGVDDGEDVSDDDFGGPSSSAHSADADSPGQKVLIPIPKSGAGGATAAKPAPVKLPKPKNQSGAE